MAKSRKESKAQQVVEEGYESVPVSGSVMAMQVPKGSKGAKGSKEGATESLSQKPESAVAIEADSKLQESELEAPAGDLSDELEDELESDKWDEEELDEEELDEEELDEEELDEEELDEEEIEAHGACCDDPAACDECDDADESEEFDDADWDEYDWDEGPRHLERIADSLERMECLGNALLFELQLSNRFRLRDELQRCKTDTEREALVDRIMDLVPAYEFVLEDSDSE